MNTPNNIIPDKNILHKAIKGLPGDHPLIIQLEESKRGLHILNHALSEYNFHIMCIQNKIIETYKKTLRP